MQDDNFAFLEVNGISTWPAWRPGDCAALRLHLFNFELALLGHAACASSALLLVSEGGAWQSLKLPRERLYPSLAACSRYVCLCWTSWVSVALDVEASCSCTFAKSSTLKVYYWRHATRRGRRLCGCVWPWHEKLEQLGPSRFTASSELRSGLCCKRPDLRAWRIVWEVRLHQGLECWELYIKICKDHTRSTWMIWISMIQFNSIWYLLFVDFQRTGQQVGPVEYVEALDLWSRQWHPWPDLPERFASTGTAIAARI